MDDIKIVIQTKTLLFFKEILTNIKFILICQI